MIDYNINSQSDWLCLKCENAQIVDSELLIEKVSLWVMLKQLDGSLVIYNSAFDTLLDLGLRLFCFSIF